jgi:hypothetical protein
VRTSAAPLNPALSFHPTTSISNPRVCQGKNPSGNSMVVGDPTLACLAAMHPAKSISQLQICTRLRTPLPLPFLPPASPSNHRNLQPHIADT